MTTPTPKRCKGSRMTELEKLAERQRIRIIALETAIELAARIFREYEDMHLAKGKREKAQANAKHAEMLEKVLKGNQ